MTSRATREFLRVSVSSAAFQRTNLSWKRSGALAGIRIKAFTTPWRFS